MSQGGSHGPRAVGTTCLVRRDSHVLPGSPTPLLPFLRTPLSYRVSWYWCYGHFEQDDSAVGAVLGIAGG